MCASCARRCDCSDCDGCDNCSDCSSCSGRAKLYEAERACDSEGTVPASFSAETRALSYPCLLSSKLDGTVVLFYERSKGVVLRAGKGNYPVGGHSKRWHMPYFKPLDSSPKQWLEILSELVAKFGVPARH